MSTATVPMQGTTTWNIDPSHSLVEFSAKHMMITTVKGRFADVRGAITLDEANPDRSTVEVEFNAASIDTRAEQRDGHLKSPDFLDVEKYPTVSFRSRRVEGARPAPGDNFRIVGDLTIRDVTREVLLDTVFNGALPAGKVAQAKLGFTATTEIDRRDYGVTTNFPLPGTEGFIVGNEVLITIDVEADLPH
jgi:polyisoprenoid-binding protein YceI